MSDPKERSKASLKRQEIRESPRTQSFRIEIEKFLAHVNAEPGIAYCLKNDLSKKTDLPYYKEKKDLHRSEKTSRAIFKQYIHYLIEFDDFEFSCKLLKFLGVQQNQTLRKIPRKTELGKKREQKIGRKNGIWEHAIPVKFILNEIIEMIREKNSSKIDQLLVVFELSGQHFLTKDDDAILNRRYKDSMPKGWNWQSPSCDLLARYNCLEFNMDVLH